MARIRWQTNTRSRPWRDVDLAKRTITISRAVVEGANGVVTEKDTKTHCSRRIAIDAETAEAWEDQRERATARATACGVTMSPSAAVFSRRADGAPWAPNDVTKAFIRLRKTVGMPDVRLHDLRHFAATRLLAAGVPVRTVSGRLGHANAATTLGVYAHFVDESDRDAAERIGALVSTKSAGSTRDSKPA